MQKIFLFSLLVLYLLTFSAIPSFAGVPAAGADAMFQLNTRIQDLALDSWGARISQAVIALLWTTSIIALALGSKDLILSGAMQLESIVALLVRILLTSGMMTWLLKNPVLLYNIPRSLGRLGGFITTGTAGNTLALGQMAVTFGKILTPIIDYHRTLSWYDFGLSITCVILVFFINCLSILFITTVLLVQIETFFILIGGMLTAAFFILGHFRDMFMGYIKALAMNGLKLLLLSLCLGLMEVIIRDEWGGTLSIAANANTIYDVFVPMTFGLMAFYIVVKSVPQYAVAILTGHASADGGLAKAAVMAGVSTAMSVYNVSRGYSNTALNTASIVNSATQSYKTSRDSALEGGSSRGAARAMGAWEATKTIIDLPIGEKRTSGSAGSGGSNNSGSKDATSNEMKPGGGFDAYKANDSYSKETK